ncbi:MAG: hypothetical protein M1453_05395 [Acidobacteria bacterium]|nr:hypothetical protein [Acidobacteriota bacterium]MCL5287412.1 hypothetical protein [Acidobacteriota bacterium]
MAMLVTVSGILFGFIFAGFWRTLDRELKFPAEERHFKIGTLMLFVALAVLAAFGIILPLKQYVLVETHLVDFYRGILVALVIVIGYMLTELAHYNVFQAPKYTTKSEWVIAILTLLTVLGLLARWMFL